MWGPVYNPIQPCPFCSLMIYCRSPSTGVMRYYQHAAWLNRGPNSRVDSISFCFVLFFLKKTDLFDNLFFFHPWNIIIQIVEVTAPFHVVFKGTTNNSKNNNNNNYKQFQDAFCRNKHVGNSVMHANNSLREIDALQRMTPGDFRLVPIIAVKEKNSWCTAATKQEESQFKNNNKSTQSNCSHLDLK